MIDFYAQEIFVESLYIALVHAVDNHYLFYGLHFCSFSYEALIVSLESFARNVLILSNVRALLLLYPKRMSKTG